MSGVVRGSSLPALGARADAGHRSRAVRAVGVIAASTFLVMSVWFSASVVGSQLQARWDLATGERSLLTIAVQLGFVVGALGLAITGLADSLGSRTLIAGGGFLAAAATLALIWAPGATTGLTLRVLTGVGLAAVYPSAIKEVSTWFRRARGTALAVMICALTLGSALPQLVRAAGGAEWRTVIVATSVLAALGGVLFLIAGRPGPFEAPRTTFRMAEAVAILRSRAVVLVNVGYAAHMWELYAMWAGVATFLGTLPQMTGTTTPSLIAFFAIGVGAAGSSVAGVLGDRVGRARTAALCLACSGSAAIALALARTGPLWVVIALCLVWGFWVVADSAPLSALMTEHVDPSYVGSAMAFQLGCGYLVTIATLWLSPLLAERYSWSVALAVLAIGPAIGTAAMAALISATGRGRQAV